MISMSKNQPIDGENVTIEVSEEDYQADLEAGIDEEATMKPGR